MNNVGGEWYLFHYTPPVDIGAFPNLFLISPEGDLRKIELAELKAFEYPLVCHSFSFLVDWFRIKSLDLPKTVVDIETAKKLIVGQPKSSFAGDVPPWNMGAVLLPYLPPEYDNIEIKRALTTHLAKSGAECLVGADWMATVTRALPAVWHDLEQKLADAGEFQRFTSVEVPAYQAMLGTQFSGIRVDPAQRDAFLSQIDDQYFSAHHALAFDLRINVDRALSDGSYLSACIGRSDIEDIKPHEIIKRLKGSDPICSNLHEIISAKRNKGILLKTFSLDNDICYPAFDLMGTVSGRILISDPQLQHLKKIYRSVLIPRPGSRHIYIDYCQFEPSIMASLSQDPFLLRLCESGDIYSNLAQSVFGNRSHRELAKTLFLSYSYGMAKQGLEDCVTSATGVDQTTAASLLDDQFFGPLGGFQEWRKSQEETLVAHGRIGTSLGNFRYRTNEGQLDSKEERWAVNQVIQGTGALILKRLICRIRSALPRAQILLPMHDALLIEIPESKSNEMTNQIVTEFKSVFADTCPGVTPYLTVKPFAPLAASEGE